MDLFADADAPETRLEVNKSYAERYAHNKRRVHLEQLQQKYGDGAEESDEDSESEDEDEDEDGEQLTPQVDAAILRTIQRIRNKDSDIYNTDQRVFDAEESRVADRAFPEVARRSDKKMTLPDYQRQRMQEIIATEADPAKAYAEATMAPRHQESVAPTHDEEQEAARAEFVAAAQGDDDGELFSVAQHTDGSDEYRRAMLDALDGKSEQPVRELVRDSAETKDGLSKENEEFLLKCVHCLQLHSQARMDRRRCATEARLGRRGCRARLGGVVRLGCRRVRACIQLSVRGPVACRAGVLGQEFPSPHGRLDPPPR